MTHLSLPLLNIIRLENQTIAQAFDRAEQLSKRRAAVQRMINKLQNQLQILEEEEKEAFSEASGLILAGGTEE